MYLLYIDWTEFDNIDGQVIWKKDGCLSTLIDGKPAFNRVTQCSTLQIEKMSRNLRVNCIVKLSKPIMDSILNDLKEAQPVEKRVIAIIMYEM